MYFRIKSDGAHSPRISNLFTASKNGADFGLENSQLSEFYYNSGDYDCQCFFLVPRGYDKKKKYPTMLLIHGGPQSSWRNSWSTRWNMALFAQQGYVLVMPNVTGTTGFGEKFMRDVLGDWGGRPYNDLVKCWEYVESNMPFCDPDRAVALGGSYGGMEHLISLFT